jgi:hypothetical protein
MRKRTLTLADAADEYLLALARKSPHHQRWVTQKLGHLVTWCRDTAQVESLEAVQASDLRRFLVSLEDGAPSG